MDDFVSSTFLLFDLQARDPMAEPATKQTNMKDITLTEVPKKWARSNIVGPFMASTIPCNEWNVKPVG